MQSNTIDAPAVARSGMALLQQGNAPEARQAFARIVSAGLADASVFLGLAFACRAMQDIAALHAALDAALALEPRNLRALMLKADHFAAAGDARAASSFYQAVVRSAQVTEDLPADMKAELARAQEMCDRYARQFEVYLQDQLSKTDSLRGKNSKRFQHSLDLLLGKKEIYFQQPRFFYFPELPQIQFYDREAFPWLDRVEAATPAIREELLEVLKDESVFTPYVQSDPNRPAPAQDGMVDNPAWSAFYLWKYGEIVAENAARCPRTLEALAEAPIARVPGRSPSILFSLLRPGARIPPHNGFVNTRLICHLPLIVPPGCGFRVGNDVREWTEGKAWVFDDSIDHEAWNQGEQTRVILLFEIWRPELTQDERDLVSTMFQAIDRYGGSANWDM